VVSLILLLSLKPVGNLGGTGGLGRAVLALNLNGHALVLLQVASEVGLLGGGGCLGDVECLDVALSVGLLDGGDLVGLELLEIKLLDKVGCRGMMSAIER
jgi:hypothetical protein